MITILVLGCVWGLIEAVFGGVLHFVHSPLTGSILGPVGFGILALAVKNGVKLRHLFFVSAIAASFKLLDAALFPYSIFDAKIINPAMAILLEGLCFVGITYTIKRPLLASFLVWPVFLAIFSVTSLATFGVPYFLRGTMTMFLVHLAVGMVLSFVVMRLALKTSPLGNLRPVWAGAACVASMLITVAATYGFSSL